MTDNEKVILMDNIIETMALSADEVSKLTSGYIQVKPNGEHQIVLLFGYDDSKNSLNKKLELTSEEEALECYQAITHRVLTQKGKLRPRLSKSTIIKSSSENNKLELDDVFA